MSLTNYNPANPLVVQGDHTILVEVDSPSYSAARDQLVRFAELVKAPEHIHTYRVTPLSIWNACAAGTSVDEITEALRGYSKYPVPANVETEITDWASRYGRLRLSRNGEDLALEADDAVLAEQISRHKAVAPLLVERLSSQAFRVRVHSRGEIKQALIKVGFPVEDLAGYVEGERLAFELQAALGNGRPFELRRYQVQAADAFHAAGGDKGGSGVITLPCGAGKTIVALACMAKLQTSTLILTTSITASRQWIQELLEKTTLGEDQIGEYSGLRKQIRPITLASYQIMTWRKDRESEFRHMELFNGRDWGLIVYDEVHLLPAPIFRVTAGLQARRRLGLTATLVREDGHEDDVFALIGPKKADVPWKVLEDQGWIAKATCTEVRIPLPEDLRMPYAIAERRDQFRIAAENERKIDIVRYILNQHRDDLVLIIGMYLDQLKKLAEPLGVPILTGQTRQQKRDEVFAEFRAGRLRVLAVSKIANFAVDLPDASVAIQISGTFGSRQEEAQRLGRILRPKEGANQAHFYTIVTRDTVEQDFALKRQLFLCEQGYNYSIVDSEELTGPQLVR